MSRLGGGKGDLTQVPGGSAREKIKILHPETGRGGRGEEVPLVILDNLTFLHSGPLPVQSSSPPFPMKGKWHSGQILRCISGPFFSQYFNSPSRQTSLPGSSFGRDGLFWSSWFCEPGKLLYLGFLSNLLGGGY